MNSSSSSDGWLLSGSLQHDSFVRPAFLQMKQSFSFSVGEEPQAIELITSPIPRSWSSQYLEEENSALSSQLVPNKAFSIMRETDTSLFVQQAKDSRHEADILKDPLPFTTKSSQHCPLPTFLSLYEMRRRGLSIDGLNKALTKECSPLFRQLIGSRGYDELDRKGLISMPMLQVLDQLQKEIQDSPAAEQGLSSVKIAAYRPLPHARIDRLQPRNAFSFDGPFIKALRQHYRAHTWLRRYAKHFPGLLLLNSSNLLAVEKFEHHESHSLTNS
jgi:hypothetical protein